MQLSACEQGGHAGTGLALPRRIRQRAISGRNSSGGEGSRPSSFSCTHSPAIGKLSLVSGAGHAGACGAAAVQVCGSRTSWQ